MLVGRAYAYGLGAGGEAGVARAIEILRTDLVRTLKLLGCPSVAALDSLVRGRAGALAGALALVNPGKKTYLDPKDLPRVDAATLRRILATLAPYRSRVALVVLAVLTASLLNLLPPFFVRRAIDQAIPNGDLRLLLLLCAGMVVGPVLAGLVGVFQKHLTTSTSETLMRDLRVSLFDHFQGLPFSYFVHAKPGEAIAGVISDVQGVGSVVATTLVDVLEGIVVFASTAAVLIYFDWRLALVTLALLPLFVLPTRSVGRERKRMRRAVQARTTDLIGILDEALSASGILLARVFGAEKFEAARLRDTATQIAELSLRQAMVGRWFRLLIGLFEAVGPALVFGFGGHQVMRHGIALGTLVAFATQLRRLYASASSLTSVHVDLVSSYAYFERVFRALDPPREAAPVGGARPEIRGALSLRGVSFAYEDGLESLTDAGPRGGARAVRRGGGAVGRGKSTLVSLLLRLHDPAKGEIRLDGHDLRSFDRAWLRSHVGVVTQETYLFHGTLWENLLYARPDASPAQVRSGGARGADPRLHRRAARGLPDGGRPARLPPVGRRASARGDRARDSQGPAHPDPRRGRRARSTRATRR